MSLFAPMKAHAPLEVAMVGNEGMVGIPLALGLRTSLVQAVVRGSGDALYMSARAFRDELRQQPILRRQVDRYIHTLLAQLTQSAGCNASHSVEARSARAADRSAT